MKTAIILTCFNRPELLKQTFTSILRNTFCPNIYNVKLICVNDGSTDPEVAMILENYKLYYSQCFNDGFEIINHSTNKGVNIALFSGFERALETGCELLTNIDSDIIVNTYWLNTIYRLWKQYPDHIISGFNTISHKPEKILEEFILKNTIGGINLMFSKDVYLNSIFPALTFRDWDYKINDYYKLPFLVTKPSILEHMGNESTMDHKNVDKSIDFKFDPWYLSNIFSKISNND